MYHYPKPYLSVQQLIQKLTALGMTIPSQSEAEEAFNTIGYYRLRGYCYHQFDQNANQYVAGTNLSDILKLYHFDTELAHLIFEYLSINERSVGAAVFNISTISFMSDFSIFSNKSTSF